MDGRWLLPGAGFLAGLLAVGAGYWPIPYSDVSLPGSLPWWGLVAVALAAAGLRGGTGSPWWMAWVLPAASVPAAIVIRVAVDTSTDPTSHNLWPFEVVIGVFVGLLFAGIGLLVGTLARLARVPVAGP